MATSNATITYNPTGSPTWQITQNPITVNPGTTTITWDVQLASGATGSIAFDTDDHHPGIKFGSDWAGGTPSGDDESWSVVIDNTIPTGGKKKTYRYEVNAIYTPQNSTHGSRKKWDPDVQADPPSVAI